MAFGTAETAKLIVDLSLTGNYAANLTKAQRGFSNLGKSITDSQGRAYKAGQQIGTGIKRGALIAVSALGALTGLLALSVKEGQEAARVQKIYATAIANSGKVSAEYVKALNAQQKALENLGGVDDELIKTEQTRLIQMGLTGKQVLKATPLILDFAKATGIDLLTATKLVGKATQGNTGALSRYGVAVDKAKAKTDPFGATMDALTKKFGGTTKALGGDFATRLAALREALADIREDAGQKLLPALTRIVDVVGRKLVPAFGKFVDRIMPEVISGLDKFADLLENGGAEEAIRGITDALGPMVDLVKVAAAPVKAIVGAFLSLPKELQTVLVGAFAVNKLTGGLVTNAAGGLVEAIGKAFLGGIRAPIVNVQGGVVNVGGGVGGAGGAAGAAGGSVLGLIGPAAIAAVVSKTVTEIANQQFAGAGVKTNFAAPGSAGDNPITAVLPFGIGSALQNIGEGLKLLASKPTAGEDRSTDAIEKLRTTQASAFASLAGKIADDKTSTKQALDKGFASTGRQIDDKIAPRINPKLTDLDRSTDTAGQAVVGAIRNKDFSFDQTLTFNFTIPGAGGTTKTIVQQSRYGPVNGSYGGDLGGPTGAGSMVHD